MSNTIQELPYVGFSYHETHTLSNYVFKYLAAKYSIVSLPSA